MKALISRRSRRKYDRNVGERAARFTDAEIGGWGAPPNGGNVSNVWLYPNFATAFPSGIVIGGYGRTLSFGCAQAITNYLPAGGTAGQLPNANYVNPKGSTNATYASIPCGVVGPQYSNILASKTLALTLNIGFDRALPNFSPNFTVTYGDLIYTAAPFVGWKMDQILTEANRLLGQGLINGQTNTYYTTVVNVISTIIAGSNGQCPVNTIARQGNIVDPIDYANRINVYPNPASGLAKIELATYDDTRATMSVYDIKGELVVKILDNEFLPAGLSTYEISCDTWTKGVYFIRCTVNDITEVKRLVIIRN